MTDPSRPFVQAAQELLAHAGDELPPADRHVQATVKSVDGSGKATVHWNGADFGTKRYSRYTPVVGDVVMVVFTNGSTPVIQDKIV